MIGNQPGEEEETKSHRKIFCTPQHDDQSEVYDNLPQDSNINEGEIIL